MWDWSKANGQIYVGDSIEEVFGYKVQNNTVNFTDFSRCLLPGEKDTVEEKLWKTLSSDCKSWEDSFMFKRKDGSFAATTSRAKIIRDEEGNAIHLIGAIKDVSRLQELEKILLEQTTIKKEHSEVFQMAAKLSYDGIWDWNILTNEFFLGEGFYELFGYAIENTGGNMSEWNKHLHPDDKEAVEKGLQDAIASTASRWEHAYRFIRADGSIANVFGRATIIRQADGKARRMIGVVHDLSRQKELEEKLDNEIATKGKLITEHNDSFKFIFNTSSDVFFDNDLVTNKVIISDAYEKDFGYEITNQMTPAEDWLSHIHPEDREAVLQDYLRMLASEDTEWKYDYRFLRADHSVAEVLSSCIILRNATGKAYRVLGYMQDISKQKVLEEKMVQEIKLKEKQIAEAAEEAKETERSDIGKELHDNVNQLLGASKLYLDMAKQGGENSEMYLSRSSEYTLKAIEEIRKLTKGLTSDIIKNLGLCEAIENITRDTMEVNPIKIFCALEGFIENSVSDKFKLNVYRIIQEQLNNILKHAKATEVTIRLSQIKKSIVLSISDDGVGFDTSQKRKGIGIVNIKSRATSYNGTADFVSQPGQGCVLIATFPVTDAL
jgi:PAS domain S-box-containing protein